MKTIEVIKAIQELKKKYKKAIYGYKYAIFDLGMANTCSLCILHKHIQEKFEKDNNCNTCINSVFEDEIAIYPCVARVVHYHLDWGDEDKLDDLKNLIKFWTKVNSYLKVLQNEEFVITPEMKKAILNIAEPYKK